MSYAEGTGSCAGITMYAHYPLQLPKIIDQKTVHQPHNACILIFLIAIECPIDGLDSCVHCCPARRLFVL